MHQLKLHKKILFIFIPFMVSYLLSELLRNINAIVAPKIQEDMLLTSEEMGLLTGTFLLSVAIMQPLSGMFLDKYGNKKTVSALLIVASIGALIFSLGKLEYLYVGRFLLGVGVAACWTAAFNINNSLWNPRTLPTANGVIIGLAGVGAMLSTYPLQKFLVYFSWQEVFQYICLFVFIVSLIIMFTPSQNTKSNRSSGFGNDLRGYSHIIKSKTFIAIGPLSVLCQGVWLAYQSLWAGQWIEKINQFDDSSTSVVLLFLALSVIAGNLIIGPIASRIFRPEKGLIGVMCLICSIFVLSQIMILTNVFSVMFVWVIFGLTVSGSILGYAILSSAVEKEYSGRALSLLNMLATFTGFIIQYVIGYLEDLLTFDYGYRASLLSLVLIQVLAIGWAWTISRKGK